MRRCLRHETDSKQTARYPTHRVAGCARCAPDATSTWAFAVSASAEGKVKTWDLDSLAEIAAVPVERLLNCLAVSVKGNHILLGDQWGNVHALELVMRSSE